MPLNTVHREKLNNLRFILWLTCIHICSVYPIPGKVKMLPNSTTFTDELKHSGSIVQQLLGGKPCAGPGVLTVGINSVKNGFK